MHVCMTVREEEGGMGGMLYLEGRGRTEAGREETQERGEEDWEEVRNEDGAMGKDVSKVEEEQKSRRVDGAAHIDKAAANKSIAWPQHFSAIDLMLHAWFAVHISKEVDLRWSTKSELLVEGSFQSEYRQLAY